MANKYSSHLKQDRCNLIEAQNVLVVIIAAAMVDFVVGTILGPTDNFEVVQGF